MQVCEDMILTALNSINEGLQFAEVALRKDLVVKEYRGVADIEVLNGFVKLANFLDGNAEDGGWYWLKGQFLHLREAVDAF